jgi:hypothetical protein
MVVLPVPGRPLTEINIAASTIHVTQYAPGARLRTAAAPFMMPMRLVNRRTSLGCSRCLFQSSRCPSVRHTNSGACSPDGTELLMQPWPSSFHVTAPREICLICLFHNAMASVAARAPALQRRLELRAGVMRTSDHGCRAPQRGGTSTRMHVLLHTSMSADQFERGSSSRTAPGSRTALVVRIAAERHQLNDRSNARSRTTEHFAPCRTYKRPITATVRLPRAETDVRLVTSSRLT